MDERENRNVVRRYLSALEDGVVGEGLAHFFCDDMWQVEYPNQLNKHGQRSDLAGILERSVKGQHLLSSQRYEIYNEVSEGNRVAVEASWLGVLAVPLGELSAGSEIRAHFAMFFELRDGRILKQHNYDCFDPM